MPVDHQPCEVAIFDFDGTVANTFAAIAAATDVTLCRHGLPPANRQRLKASVGLSLPTVFGNITGGVLTATHIDDLVRTYRSVFSRIAASKVIMFDGIPEQLDRFHRAGITLAIATSKSRRGVHELLDTFGITSLFAVVVTDDMVTNKKPHPEMCTRVLETVGASPDRAVMVGDAVFDIDMGQAAGLRTCAVTWGNQTREELARADPDHIVDSPDQLAPVLLPDITALTKDGASASR